MALPAFYSLGPDARFLRMVHMKRVLQFVVALLPVVALAQGTPDFQITAGIEYSNTHKTAVEPTTLNHVIVDSIGPAVGSPYFRVTTNILSPTPSSHTVQIPNLTMIDPIYVEVSRSGGASGGNVALHFSSALDGIFFSIDSGASFQNYMLPTVAPYTGLSSFAMKFGPDGNLYVDYYCSRGGSTSQDKMQLRRLKIDPNGVATNSLISMASTVTIAPRSLSMVATDRYIVTHFSPGPTYVNTSVGPYWDVPAVAVTDTQTSTTTIRHVGKPPPAGGTAVAAYNTGKAYLATDGRSVFIANPVPLTNGHLNEWKVWQLPENGGDFFPNTVGTPSWPAIHDLSLRTDGTDINTYMTMTQTTMRLGLIHGIYAPYDPSGNNTKVRMAYLTPDQRAFVGGTCVANTVQVVDLVNPNGGAYSATPMALEDFPACFIESALGWIAQIDSGAGAAGYYSLPGGFITSYGARLTIPGFPVVYGIHFADLTP